MTQNASRLTWEEANHAYLVEQFARLERLLQPDELAADLEKRPAPSEPSSSSPSVAIDRLTEMFGLSPFERELLLLCAGVEMESRLAARCADAQGHPQKSYASFGLAMGTLPEAHWSAFTPARPLRRYRMIEVQSGGPLTSSCLRIDERILHYL